ncbi:MAG: bifunctional 5,10-methylenetetrahydrofolate dehydrogenase/5,10-methenyltetrahydrofolate cyclohydrolase [Chloroflexota bacterium]
MTARILLGKEVAGGVRESIAARVQLLRGRSVVPHLAFVTLGASPEASVYVNRLEKLAGPVGIAVTRHALRGDVPLSGLDDLVQRLNDDDEVDGVIVQMPLPPHLTSEDLSTIIDPRKDVDGITVNNAGRLYLGMPGQRPSTAVAMMEILRFARVNLAALNSVVIGRSQVVGHPLAELLLAADATVTVTHRQTRDLAEHTRLADVLLVAAGHPRLITASMIRPGVVIIDAGINVEPEGIQGDVDFEGCLPIAGAITPVPGGVGPVTNSVVLRNVVDSAELRGR